MVIKQIFFDWGGVLSFNIYNSLATTLAEKESVDPLRAMIVLDKFSPPYEVNKIPGREFWNRIIHELHLKMSMDSLIHIACKSNRLNFEIYELATVLKDRYALGILSNNINELTTYIRSNFELHPFKHIIFSNEVRVRKPEQAIYNLALEKAEVKPEESVFIDDLPANVSAASKIGIHAICYHDSLQLKEDLKRLGVTT